MTIRGLLLKTLGAAGLGIVLGLSLSPSPKPTSVPDQAISRSAASANPTETVPHISPVHTDDPLLVPLTSPKNCLALLASLETLSGYHPLRIRVARDRALRQWLLLDPEDAHSFAEQDFTPPWGPGISTNLFRVWLDLDADSALEAFTQTNRSLVSVAAPQFFRDYAQIDPARAVAELAKPRWASLENYALESSARETLGLWAAVSPKDAALSLLEFKHPLKWAAALGVAERWASKDPQAAWAFFQEHHTDQPRALGAIAAHLLKSDPNFDIGDLATNPRTRFGQEWAGRDREAAVTFALSRPEEDSLRHQILAKAGNALATAEPIRALGLLSDHTRSEYEHSSTLRTAFASLASRGLDDSMEAFQNLKNASDRTNAMKGIMTYQIAADPNAAVTQWRTWLDDASMFDSVLPAMAVALSQGHGGGHHDLGAIVDAIPEFEPHVKGYVLEGWMKTAPEDAANFIAKQIQQGDGAEYRGEKAIAELATIRPEFMATWLETIPSSQFRNEAAAMLGINWSLLHPEAAEAWVQSLPQEDETRAFVENMMIKAEDTP